MTDRLTIKLNDTVIAPDMPADKARELAYDLTDGTGTELLLISEDNTVAELWAEGEVKLSGTRDQVMRDLIGDRP